MKPVIPEKARQRVIERHPNGKKRKTYHYIGGNRVGSRIWDKDSHIVVEYAIRDGLHHGRFRYFDEDGRVSWEGSCANGKEHGIARQYDHKGNLIGTSRMHHGTGVDLWYQERGKLSEERYIVDGHRNGFERWWNLDQRSVWKEASFKDDLEHGIQREWNSNATLKRGCPRYFVNGRQVTKRQYLKACATDRSLPAFRSSDDVPRRRLPRKWMRASNDRRGWTPGK